jgi:hypothetical protein
MKVSGAHAGCKWAAEIPWPSLDLVLVLVLDLVLVLVLVLDSY